MSIKIMSQAWGAKVKGADKLGLLALADYANDDGLAYPSYDTFAGKVGTSRRQALRIIEKLEAAGEIYKAPNPRKTAVNRYVVVTCQDEAEIAKRLIAALRIAPKDAASVASDIIGKRATSATGVTSNTTTSDIHDTTTSDAGDTSLVTPVTPYPLKNHQTEPSEKTNGIAAPPPAPKSPTPIYAVYEQLLTIQRGLVKEPTLKVVKELLGAGFCAADIAACARWIITEPWHSVEGKPFSAAEIPKRIDFWIKAGRPSLYSDPRGRRGGHAPAQTYRKPTQAEIDAAKAAPIVEV
jgi:hypothetical protein